MGASYLQQYILQKGLKVFQEAGEEAATKEMDQLHKRNCFTPVSIKEMTDQEKKKAMEAVMFLAEKRDESIKSCSAMSSYPPNLTERTPWPDKSDFRGAKNNHNAHHFEIKHLC